MYVRGSIFSPLVFESENLYPVRSATSLRFTKISIVPGIGVFILSLVFLQGCRKDMEFQSHWRQQEIIVDGNDTEWQGNLVFMDKHPVAIGIKNDNTDLYLLFSTTDRNTKQTLMRRGLTIWFNTHGKKKKTFGIRYPIGLGTYLQMRPYDPDEWQMKEQERLELHMGDMLREMEIIGPGDQSRNHTFIDNPYGISLALTDTASALVYELKIPLQSTDGYPYQIGAKPGNSIRVGLETGSMEGQMVIRSGSGQGGMAGGGQGSGGIRRTGPQGGGRQMGPSKPLELWLELQLAVEN